MNLLLDARPDPARSRADGDYMAAIFTGTLQQLLSLQATLEEPAPDHVFAQFMPPPPATVKQRAARKPGGYVVEFAIPYAWLDEKQGGPWEAFRLDLSISDFDTGDHEGAQVHWLPSRFGDLALPVTGTFERR